MLADVTRNHKNPDRGVERRNAATSGWRASIAAARRQAESDVQGLAQPERVPVWVTQQARLGLRPPQLAPRQTS